MRFILFIFCILLFISNLYGQNFDINSESVSTDYLLLKSIQGLAPLDEFSVLPQPLRKFSTIKDSVIQGDAAIENLRQYIQEYYYPLLQKNDSQEIGDLNDELLWFEKHSGRYHAATYSDSLARLACDAAGMMRVGYASLARTSSNIGLARLSARSIGSLGDNFGFMLDLSNGVRLSGEPLAIAQTDPVLGRTFKFVSDEQKFFDRYIGYVQYQSSWFRASFGRQPYSLGFSPIDNLIHSRNAPLYDMLLLDVPYKSVRFTSIHGAVEGADDAGNAYLNKYIASHRIAVSPSDWLAFSISDMIVYSGRGLDFAYLNPLGFYVSTGLGTPQKSRDDNSLLSIDAAIRPWNGAMIYGALLVDDLSYSTLTDTSWLGNNNKYAWQIGASQIAFIREKPMLLSGEYVRINPFVYSHRGIVNSWTHLGAPLGYDMQPNSDRWSLQAKYWFSPRIFAQIDLDYTRHGENYLDSSGNIVEKGYDIGGKILVYPVGNVGGDALRGDGDFLFPEPYRIGNRFLRGNVSYSRRVRFLFSAEVLANIFTDIRFAYQNRNGGNAPGENYWLTFELRVGY